MAARGPALMRQLGQASMAGLMLAACIFVGTGLGVWLDRWLGTRPWLTIFFMLLGIVAGFYNVFKIVSALSNPRRL
jgi:ATP synthase protein I